MKRAWWVAVLALVVATSGAVVARASGTGSMGSESKMSMAKGSAKSDTELQEKLEAIERKVWDAIKSRDVKTAMEAMAEDSWSVDMSGFSSAQQFGQMMQDYTVESYSLQDLKLIRLDKDAAILAYTSTANATYKGEPIPSGPYYCSSIYVNRGGKWLGMFHQETLSQSAMWSEPQNGRTGDIVHPDSTHHHR